MNSGDIGQLYTWQGLYSIAQMSMLLYIIVQFSKTLIDRYFPGFPTDFYSLIMAYFIIITIQAANGSDMSDWRNWVLGFFNSFIIVSTSGYIANKSQNPPTIKSQRRVKSNGKSDTPIQPQNVAQTLIPDVSPPLGPNVPPAPKIDPTASTSKSQTKVKSKEKVDTATPDVATTLLTPDTDKPIDPTL